MLTADRDQVLAFRMTSHNLTTPGALLEIAGACGIAAFTDGSAALSLRARVAGLTRADVDRSLGVEKTLLLTWSLRGSPHLFPTADAAVFTLGLLPPDEAALRFFIFGAEEPLTLLRMGTAELIERTAAAVLGALDGRAVVSKRELDLQVARQAALSLTAEQLAVWQSPSMFAEGQVLGEALVSFAFRLVALQGLICFAPEPGSMARFVRTDQWLGVPLGAGHWPGAPDGREAAQAELARRYLQCYGPSTVAHFAEWAGIAPAQAAAMWRLVEPELAAVSFAGRTTWLLERDHAALLSPPKPAGVRLLPPQDQYLQLRDRTTLLRDKAVHRRLWRTSGNPGAVLADGELVAMWRPEKTGRRLSLSIELCAPVTAAVRDEMVAEAENLAVFKGCTLANVTFA